MEPSQQRWIGVGVAALGAILLVVALTTDWWVIEQAAGGAKVEYGLAPYEQDTENEPFKGTEGETIMVGLLATLGLAGGLALTVLLIGHAASIPGLARVPLSLSLVAGGAVTFLAVIAVAMAATTWPNEDENEEFWDEKDFSGFGAGDVTVAYRPGAGWWLEIAGGIAALGGAIVAWLARSPSMVSPSTYPTRVARPGR